MPDRLNNYQLPSWPPTKITREIWNAVLGDIGVRLRDRETLEASFERLQQQGIQAALDYIQVSIAPQLSALQQTIQQSKDQIDDLLQGNAPNAHKLGGQLPAYYAKSSELQSLLQVVGEKADTDDVTAMIQQRIAALVDSSPATLDTLKELAQALNNDANFSVTVTNALAELETKIKQAGAPIGTTIMMQGNGNTPPPGYLLHNGAPCTSAYPQLRAWLLANGATVNGNGDPIIEDMGGYFPRGWRSGQVVDSGRAFGSVQQDAFQGFHIGNSGNKKLGDFLTNISGGSITQGALRSDVTDPAKPVSDGTNGAPRMAGETRPSNKTFTYWIKAYAPEQVAGAADLAALLNNVQALQTKVNSAGLRKGAKVVPSGAAVLYSGLPANISRVRLKLKNVTFSPNAAPIIRLGTSAGIVSSGYSGGIGAFASNVGYASQPIDPSGIVLLGSPNVNPTIDGELEFSRVPGGNDWQFTGQFFLPAGSYHMSVFVTGGVSLPGELDRIQLSTAAPGTAVIGGAAMWAEWEFAV
ncbi:hypothetical protein EYC79_18150 [Agrobacterium cavarae]|uniref:Bacteriophage tail fiber protein n=1 Tax=Agrobacterium cavarae TaxID=2528239 RepID=A0ABY1Y6L0_9HYPH|nr:hypothetical protein [Agrobacterium cavarae]TBN10872.1 hypothetical protein EYC79_18150 [Agrobacterium cavarae]